VFQETDPAMFWLNVTNFALGAVVVIACAVVFGSILREVLAHAKSRARAALPLDDHSFVLPELGLTMADGGEKDDTSRGHSDAPSRKR
jgi:hypothetical protein